MTKNKIFMTAAAFILAIGGAFATASSNNGLAEVQAYLPTANPPGPCNVTAGFCETDILIPCEVPISEEARVDNTCVQLVGQFVQ